MRSPRMESLKSSLKSSPNSRMKCTYLLAAGVLAVGLMSIAIAAFGQAENQKSDTYNSAITQNSEAQMSDMHKVESSKAQADAEKSFDEMKTIAGVWQGRVTADPPQLGMDNKPMQVSLHVTSRGHAIVHEMREADKPDDPSHYDHPVTMFYVDNDRLLLTHYCDAGNRPRMAGKLSPDGKQVEFNFLDRGLDLPYARRQAGTCTYGPDADKVELWARTRRGEKVAPSQTPKRHDENIRSKRNR